MKPHILYAREYWERFISPGDSVVDATLGNGHDILFLAHLLKGKGCLVGYDIQQQAIAQTQNRLNLLPKEYQSNIHLKLKSHVFIEESEVKLIIYNLGYLPGGDKSITTLCDTTILSIQRALSCLQPGGAISITCYPGHQEGAKEEKVIIEFLKQLSQKKWRICHHVWLNRPQAPSLIWLQGEPDA